MLDDAYGVRAKGCKVKWGRVRMTGKNGEGAPSAFFREE